ncbi:MAG: M16 family metallopeptidase, partial [Planctomycetota bacterium]
SAPIVSSQIWYGVGSADEGPGETGLAHFLEHLMFKGTDRYAKGEIDRITLKLGGSNNAGTSKDFTQYYFNFASDRWETALEIEANRMRNLAIDPVEFEAERKVVLEELMLGRDSPWDELDETLQATCFLAHPYGHPIIGWRHDVETVTRETVKAFYDRHYHPRNATLVIVGDFDTRTALARVNALFGPIPPGPEPSAERTPEPPQNGERRVVVRRDTELTRLEILYHTVRVSHPDDAVLDVIQQLLAGGKAARLTRRLVEDEALVTFVKAANDTRRDPGVFWIWTELLADADPAAVERIIHEETDRLGREEVTGGELARTKKAIVSELVFNRATNERRADEIGLLATVADWRLTASAERRIAAVTPADVKRVAQRVFTARNRTVGLELTGGKGRARGGPEREARRNARDGGGAAGGVAVRLSPTVKRLENGLTLIVTRHATVPVFAMEVFVDAGRRVEKLRGLGHFTGRYLLEGAGDSTGIQLAERIQEIGAAVETRGTGLSARCLSEDAGELVPLVADLLRRPRFLSDPGRKLRERTLSEIRADRDDPRTLARLTFDELLRQPYPYPPKGTESDVERLYYRTARDHHAKFYVPGNTVIAAVSDLPESDVVELLEGAFEDWRGTVPDDSLDPLTAHVIETVREDIQRDTDQVNIYLGHEGIGRTDPDYFALLVMDYVLGMGPGFTDRLSRTLRDRDGLAYLVYASITSSAVERVGAFRAYIGTSAENRDRAIDAIIREIRRIREEEVSPEELADAKAYLTGSFVFGYETAEQVARRLIHLHRYGLGFDYPARFAERVNAITGGHVLRVARKHLHPDRLIIVTVGPGER